MPSTMVELRPNRRLLDHNFEGYKLNLEALPQWSTTLAVKTDRVYPDEVQYSFLHAKLFALHNHLVADGCRNLFYVDSKQQVRMATFNSISNTFDITVVYDVPAHVERKSGHFNLCLSFPSDYLAVVTDGTGYLHIVVTGNRNTRESWKTSLSDLVLGEGKYFVVVDSRIQEINEQVSIHCLLQSVEQNDQHFYTVLTWVTYTAEGNNWKQTSMRQLQGKGPVHYAALESSLTAVYIASDNQFKFTVDTQTEIIEPVQEQSRQILYTWLQTSDDITITLKLPGEHDKQLFHVSVTPAAIKVSYAGNLFLEGQLKHRVDSEITTWHLQDNGQVDILITKSESKIWGDLLENGDDKGEQILDPSLVEEAHKRLAHLCSETEVTNVDQSVPGFSTQELEECDAASEEDTVLVRQDVFSHTVSHQVPLSVHQYLFSVRTSAEAPALALRHDVDGCVWQPRAARGATWPVTHEGTLMAFGYIQSSKQNRKFATCPPDFSYSVVCETSRHVFIYKAAARGDGELRRRVGGGGGGGGAGAGRLVAVGRQHVVNVDPHGEVLGIFAANTTLYLLTETSLVAIGVA